MPRNRRTELKIIRFLRFLLLIQLIINVIDYLLKCRRIDALSSTLTLSQHFTSCLHPKRPQIQGPVLKMEPDYKQRIKIEKTKRGDVRFPRFLSVICFTAEFFLLSSSA